MKAIMVMFDSHNRRMLPPYGADWVHTPNFERLARQTVTFDRSFVGSILACPPAEKCTPAGTTFSIVLGGHWSLLMTHARRSETE